MACRSRGGLGTRRITFVAPIFKDNTAGAISWGGIEGEVISPKFDGWTNSGTRGLIDIPASGTAGHLTITNPTFRNMAATSNTKPIFNVHSVSAGYLAITGMDVDVAGTIANFSGAHCSITDSPRINCGLATTTAGIYFAGTDGRCCRNYIESFYDSIVYFDTTATGGEAIDNTLAEPINNASPPIFFGVKAQNVRANKVRRASAAAGYGIRLNAGADNFNDNNVDGFTGSNAFQISGTVYSASGNIANGTPLAEVSFTLGSGKSISDGGEAFLGTAQLPTWLPTTFAVAYPSVNQGGLILYCSRTSVANQIAVYGHMISGAGSYTVPSGTVITIRQAAEGA